MGKRDEKAFRERLNRLLMDRGKHFQGIRLRCRQCGEIAFAANILVAETFGWSQLIKAEGPEYTGICIDCRDLPTVNTKPDSN